MNESAILRQLFKPLGIAPRRFLVDYHDGKKYFHAESLLVGDDGNTDDTYIRDGLIQEYAAKGFVVYSILEIMGDDTIQEVAGEMGVSPDRVKSCLRPVYADKEKERLTSYGKNVPS